MNPTAFPRQDARTLSDDGDAFSFCSTCAFSQACMAEGMDKRSLMDLHVLVEHIGPFHAGDHIFRVGDPFEAIAAVRAGTVKTYLRLAPETVSRVLRRFQKDGLLAVDRRELELLERAKLEELAEPVLRA